MSGTISRSISRPISRFILILLFTLFLGHDFALHRHLLHAYSCRLLSPSQFHFSFLFPTSSSSAFFSVFGLCYRGLSFRVCVHLCLHVRTFLFILQYLVVFTCSCSACLISRISCSCLFGSCDNVKVAKSHELAVRLADFGHVHVPHGFI